MKILYYSSPSFADCDFPLVKALREEGHDVTYLISLTPYSIRSTLFDIKRQIPENDIFPANRYKELRVYEKYMDMSKVFIANRTVKQDTSLISLRMMMKIAKFIRKGNFDVVHTDCMLSMWNIMLYKMFGKKMVLTVHDPFPHTGESNARKSFNYKIAMKMVKNFVLLNSKQKEKFCCVYNICPTRILINRLGVYDNIHTFVSGNASKSSNNVLFFGRISPYKGIEYLCQAMVEVKKQVPDATLTIAGGGKMYFDISSYEKLDWVNVINRYVDMKELAGLLQRCAITVCPYTDATQSGVIMTSYSLCKPVVATDVGGLGEMVEHGNTGLLVPPKDVDALANAIIALLKNDTLRTDMEMCIKKEYFTGEKSWKAIAEKYIEFYKSMI